MYDNKKILAVIPARGGSKGIPRKNIRLLAGKPLIAYSIEATLRSKYIDKAVVSTEDEEIGEIARRFGVETIKRPKKMAKDEITLDPVIYHTVKFLEEEGHDFDIIITIQPTSPLLKTSTIDTAIEKLVDEDYDTLISVVDDTHLLWTKLSQGKLIPMYKERINRQRLQPIYKETGGILLSLRKFVKRKSRIGDKIGLIELDELEGVDIDSRLNWWVAERFLKQAKVVLRVDGYREIGLGHIYRSLSLANRMIDHEIYFLMNKKYPLGINMVKEHNYPVIEFDTNPLQAIEEISPHIVINDILDTGSDYIKKLCERGIFVINFEDLGEGAEHADLVINALYSSKLSNKKCYSGLEYECLREEFFTIPQKKIESKVDKILVTFGGTDQNNFTSKVVEALDGIPFDFKIDIVLGLGYSHKNELKKTLNAIKKQYKVSNNIKSMSRHIYDADIVITSAGRTVLEVASIGTPCIVLAQNERELAHVCAKSENGIINLGDGTKIRKKSLEKTVIEFIKNYEKRKKMSQRMSNLLILKGCDRVVNLIFEKFEENRGKSS